MTEICKPTRGPLHHDLRIRISKNLQLRLLEEIGRHVARAEVCKDLVFHGGTSLSLLHGSPRWSEDLDFMAAPRAAKAIMDFRLQIEAALQLRASLEMPGAAISVTAKRKSDEPQIGDVEKLMVRWEHPAYVGAVKVKVELYITPPERLYEYDQAAQYPVINDEVSKFPIMAATPLSIWADKIIAIAQRPMLKRRDIHDLGFLHGILTSDVERHAALNATMGIYDRNSEDIRNGLERDIVRNGIEDQTEFREEMARWFTEREMLFLKGDGHLDRLYQGFLKEFALGREMVHAMSVTPGKGSYESCGF
ncbi:nucleotidyl transferase AbiEii/AbiGii toxin family protein [Epibacterium sp. DP7N7-1]|nr:nucleotidyl transferase AbiEii/AbiGii toxin family protein [Epibacterium sp. DP7N7-1]